jgi:ABC-type nickel/cobalt efflux system permease component RcnA
MYQETIILLITAISIGFIHTILGPDHYVPFIVMSKAGKWSKQKTIWVTVLSGIGHVLSSVLLGIIGIGFGIGLHNLEIIETSRGEIAAWLMIAFGIIYFIWGLKKAFKSKTHEHIHKHKDGIAHSHPHNHYNEHEHAHEQEGIVNLTPWILFTIFVFGPCEALIPILMFPAANESIAGLIFITLAFGLSTILTMTGIVLIGIYGINFISLNKLEKYSHAIAGFLIFLSGGTIQFLGL